MNNSNNKKGFNVIADDLSPILRSDFKTYCFPLKEMYSCMLQELVKAKTSYLILFSNATSLGSGTISGHLYIASTLELRSSSYE